LDELTINVMANTVGNMGQMKKTKLKSLKKLVKEMVFQNAALCDECVNTAEKIHQVTEERKFLLKKVLCYESDRSLELQLPGLSSVSRFPQSQQSLRAILSNLTAQEGAVAKAMAFNRKKQIAKLKEKVKKKYAKKKTVKEVLEEQSKSQQLRGQNPDTKALPNENADSSIFCKR